jgi:hypothetical protein
MECFLSFCISRQSAEPAPVKERFQNGARIDVSPALERSNHFRVVINPRVGADLEKLVHLAGVKPGAGGWQYFREHFFDRQPIGIGGIARSPRQQFRTPKPEIAPAAAPVRKIKNPKQSAARRRAAIHHLLNSPDAGAQINGGDINFDKGGVHIQIWKSDLRCLCR